MPVEPCSLCGTEDMTNVRLETEQLQHYYDGPPPVRLPGVVLCRACANDLREYLEAGVTAPPTETTPFTRTDVEAVLERLTANEHLCVTWPGARYGLRHRDGEWLLARVATGRAETVALDREEVVETLSGVSEITIKRVDERAWDRFASDDAPHDRRPPSDST